LCRRGRRSRRRAQRLCLLLQVAGTPASTGTRRGWPEYVPHRAFGVSLSTRAVASRRANAAASSLSRLSPGDDDLRSRTPCAYNAKSRSSLIFSLLFVNTFVADFVICQEVSARDVPARLPADVTRCVVAQLSTCVEMSTLARTSNACFFYPGLNSCALHPESSSATCRPQMIQFVSLENRKAKSWSFRKNI
jgi:hypothetical protein